MPCRRSLGRRNGFSSPYTDGAQGPCTACPDNTERRDDSSPRIIDHILMQGVGEGAQCERILDEVVSFQIEGAKEQHHLSDHYGLACDVN